MRIGSMFSSEHCTSSRRAGGSLGSAAAAPLQQKVLFSMTEAKAMTAIKTVNTNCQVLSQCGDVLCSVILSAEQECEAPDARCSRKEFNAAQ